MKSWMIQSFAGAAIVLTGVQGYAQTEPIDAPTRLIVVSLEDHQLALVEDGQLVKQYSVAVGKPSTPTPEGEFTIERRVANPTYQHNGKTVAPGPGNPVGTRWMGLSKAGYGIHGTNEPGSIGKSASHGCVRMSRADLEEFYKLVSIGDRVRILGHRNEETAALFQPTPAAAPAPAAQQAEAQVQIQVQVQVQVQIQAQMQAQPASSAPDTPAPAPAHPEAAPAIIPAAGSR